MAKIIVITDGASEKELKKLKKHLENKGFNFVEENEASSKEQKISRIKEIIAEWGSTTTAELEADCSPCVSSSGTNKMNVSTLVESFYSDSVELVTYNNETVISYDDASYEDLQEDVIDDILELLEEYDAEQEKTMERCQG